MQFYNMYDAKTNLSKLVAIVLQGEEVIIGKSGKPLIKLVAFDKQSEQRRPGFWKNKLVIKSDFDQVDKQIEELFYGNA